ncbi:hypothetical protein [Actinoplanes sp. NPDC051494]
MSSLVVSVLALLVRAGDRVATPPLTHLEHVPGSWSFEVTPYVRP